MPSQNKLIKQGIYLTESVFEEIRKRLDKGVKSSDTMESFLTKTKEFTMNNPLVVSGYKDKLLEIILQETNNHQFSRPAQKELTRLTIEKRVGDLIVDVGDDIKESVRDIVKHGYNNNLSQDEIAENITHRVSVIKNTRARCIARTEIARTATASDYVINVERGATHFSVDCRDTCCTICEEDYDFGKKEYTIDQVEMLPPRHPNCRCYARFYKKDGEQPPLTKTPPTNSYAFHDEFDKSNQIGVNDDNWTIKGIQKSLEGFVDKDDNIELLSENIFNFIQKARNHDKECLIASDKDFNEIGIIKGDSETSIKMPDEYIDEVEGSYFGLAGHSHPNSKVPLPDLYDLNYGCITLKSKYNLIFAPEFGVTLIKKSKPKVKPHEDDIKKAHENAYTKQDKYLNDCITKEMDYYKQKIRGNYHISMIQKRKDRNAIRANVKLNSLKNRVEFYNDEFKQYGIEFLYVIP